MLRRMGIVYYIVISRKRINVSSRRNKVPTPRVLTIRSQVRLRGIVEGVAVVGRQFEREEEELVLYFKILSS
jgi:hypothetical protein